MKESTRVLAALVIAIVLGLVIAGTRSASLLAAADFVAPLGTIWVNAIRMTVIPLVVALIITGVASATNVAAIGRMGGRTIVVCIALILGAAIVVMPVAPSLFALLPTTGVRPSLPAGAVEAAQSVTSGGQAQTFGTWLVSLIPSN